MPASSRWINVLKKAMPFLVQYAIQVIAAGRGIPTWLVGLFINSGGQRLLDWLNDQAYKAKRKEEQEAAQKAADQIAADPNSTADDIGKAQQDAWNAGRK